MYSRQEAAVLKKEFWTTFGIYMKPVPNAEGETTNWLNYKTGEKDILFTMDADNKKAIVGIYITHKDPEIQHLYFEQFFQLKNLLNDTLGEEWTWQLHVADNHGRTISRIFTEKDGVNIFNKEGWPELISFLKPRIIALDEFWSNARYVFELLR